MTYQQALKYNTEYCSIRRKLMVNGANLDDICEATDFIEDKWCEELGVHVTELEDMVSKLLPNKGIDQELIDWLEGKIPNISETYVIPDEYYEMAKLHQ